MRIYLTIIVIIIMNLEASPQSFFDNSSPLVSTFSIVARDPATGEMGIAVQSHWFNVGAIVGWGESGVGVVATQSFVNPSYGLQGLELLKAGKSPKEVVEEMTSSDSGRDYRQLAVLDTKGWTSSYTGSKCIQSADNIAAENFSVQANLMLNDKVVPAMYESFKNSTGPLAERMIAALEAAQSVGGDIRGMQSASIMVFKGQSSGKPWEDKLIDNSIRRGLAILKDEFDNNDYVRKF